MRFYKLTTKDGFTRKGERNETEWGINVSHTAKGSGGLCSDGVIHCYRTPLLAVLLNPAHANISDYQIWECEGDNIIEEKADKCGVKILTTRRKVMVKKAITSEVRIRFAIGCALLVNKEEEGFKKWALGWLNDTDRTINAANTAAAYVAVNAASAAAANAAANAANTAAAAAAAANAAANAALSCEHIRAISIWAKTDNPKPLYL